jgi:predicted RND superfamily exporter protein
VVARDGRAIAITATVDKGATGFQASMDRIYAVAEATKRPGLNVAVSGFPMYLGQLEIFSQRMVFLFPLAVLIVGLLHFDAFRTFQGFALPLVTALLSVIWGLGMMGFAGVPMDAFNQVTPILILAVTAGHAVQLLKRYYEEFDRWTALGHEPVEANRLAVVSAMERVGLVMISAGLVAVAAFFSLMTSEIATIRSFGIFTGLGILSGLLIEMTFIPALRSGMKPPKSTPKVRMTEPKRRSLWDRMTDLVATLTLGPSRPAIYTVAVATAGVLAFGISGISLENSTRSYFSKDLFFQKDDQLINERMGGTNTLYVVFEGTQDDIIKDAKALRSIAGIQDFIDSQPGVGKTVSIADMIKRLNQAMNGEDPARHTIPESSDLISQYLLLYSMSGESTDFDSYVDFSYRRASITAYLKDSSNSYVNSLITSIDHFVARNGDSRLKVYYGGSAPETAALAEILVKSKFENIIQMAGVVFIVSALIFHSFLAGLLVLTPLVITLIVNYGVMGLAGIPLNTPNSISAALGIGIGADYAIYLLYRIREELGHTSDLADAIRSALGSAGKAVLYVGSAIAGGYAVLTLSVGFNVHIWFGSLIVLSMIVSVLSALFLIPSLLMTFRPRFLLGASEERAVGSAAANATAP